MNFLKTFAFCKEKTVGLLELSLVVSASILLVSCEENGQQASKQNSVPAIENEKKPVKQIVTSTNYLLGEELRNSNDIYCAASRGPKKSLALIAFKFAEEDEASNQVKINPNTKPGKKIRNCDLSKLTVEGLQDFTTARNQAKFQRSVGTFATIEVNGQPKRPRIYISQFEDNIEERLSHKLERMKQTCVKEVSGEERHKFQKFVKMNDCDEVKEFYALLPSHTFLGVAKNENPPAIVQCAEPNGVYPDGACFLDTWYKNRDIRLTFSAKDLPIWRGVRSAVFSLLDKRLVALTGRYGCEGKFCSSIGRGE